jgi:FOG: Ankyrin repeat
VSLLLSYKADPNIQTIEKKTPLHYAVVYKEPEIIKLLLKHEANPSIKDNSGQTPADLANEFYYLFIIEHPLTTVSEASSNKESWFSIEALKESVVETKRNSTKESLFNFFYKLSMINYFKNFVAHGFDDLDSIVFQMKTPMPITQNMLKIIGIENCQQQTKIIEKLEKKAKKIVNKTSFSELGELLYELNLFYYLVNFNNSGFDDLKILVEAAFKEHGLSDKILLEDLKILKFGHRVRILGMIRHMATQKNESNFCVLL